MNTKKNKGFLVQVDLILWVFNSQYNLFCSPYLQCFLIQTDFFFFTSLILIPWYYIISLNNILKTLPGIIYLKVSLCSSKSSYYSVCLMLIIFSLRSSSVQVCFVAHSLIACLQVFKLILANDSSLFSCSWHSPLASKVLTLSTRLLLCLILKLSFRVLPLISLCMVLHP